MSERSSTTRPVRRDQQSSASIPGLKHSRRSYTAPGGMHVTVESASYTSPGLSFGSSGGNGFDPFGNLLRPTRAASAAGLLGGALGLLGGLSSLHAQQRRLADEQSQSSMRRAYVVDEDSYQETDSDSSEYGRDLAYGSSGGYEPQNRSVIGKIKDRPIEGRQHRMRSEELESPQSPRRASRARRADREAPSTSATGARNSRPLPRRTETVDSVRYRDHDLYDSYESLPGYREHKPQEQSDRADRLKLLERMVDDAERRYQRAATRFRQASQCTMIDSVYLQEQLNDVKLRETLWLDAKRNLDAFNRDGLEKLAPERQDPQPKRTRRSRRADDHREDQVEDEADLDFLRTHHISSGFGGFYATTNHIPVPVFSAFEAFDPFQHRRMFDHLFAQMESDFGFHASPRHGHFAFTTDDGPLPKRSAYTNNTSYTRQPQSNTTRPPQPPSNPLTQTEAARLFAVYNSKWLSLAPSSPNIPYPSRTLSAAALSDSTTITSPSAATWSAENIMQANTALFFLLAHDLQPMIADDTGAVQFHLRTARQEDIKGLVRALKKEQQRWHSDTLGRRNGGVEGINEALQRDQRARAVWDGVQGLLEFAVGKA